MARPSPARHGLTLTELLMVFVLMGVLAAVLAALVQSLRKGRDLQNQQKCSMYLNQIMGACIAYTTTEDAPWPSPWPKDQELSTIHIADAHEARLITVHTLSIVAKVMSLSNACFRCPSCAHAGPATVPALDRAGALAWGAGPEHLVSYAWDWGASEEPDTARVMGADRSPVHHQGKVMAVFGDSHTRALKAAPGTATGLVTEDCDGSPVTTIVRNPDAAVEDGDGDNIYSPAGDGGDPLRPGHLRGRTSWVK